MTPGRVGLGEETYKILGGLGYLLSALIIIPYLPTVGIAIAGVAWYTVGRKMDDTLMRAGGILMIVVAAVLLLSGVILGLASFWALTSLEAGSFGFVLALAGLGIMILVLGLLSFVLEIRNMVRARKISNLIRWGGYVRILSVIVIVIGVVVVVASLMRLITPGEVPTGLPAEFPTEFMELVPAGASFFVLLLGLGMLALSDLLAAIGFFTGKVPEEELVTI